MFTALIAGGLARWMMSDFACKNIQDIKNVKVDTKLKIRTNIAVTIGVLLPLLYLFYMIYTIAIGVPVKKDEDLLMILSGFIGASVVGLSILILNLKYGIAIDLSNPRKREKVIKYLHLDQSV